MLYKTFFELYPRDPKAAIYSFRLTDYPDYSRQIIINLDGYTIYDDATDKFVVLAEPSELSERLETLNLVVHLINHPDYQEAQQKLHTLEPGETAKQPINAIDALRQEQQKLDGQIAKLRARQIAIDQNITDLKQLEREEKMKVESKRITAFLNEHPELTYKITHDDNYFYTDLNSDVYIRYNYPNSELTLEKAFEDIECYLQLLPVLQADKTLLGNIADRLNRLNSDIAYNIRLNPNNTVTVHAQDFDTWYGHQVEQDGITVSYGYPEDEEPLTILFDLEETYDGSDGFAELPQMLRDMTDRIATLKKTTKSDSNDD